MEVDRSNDPPQILVVEDIWGEAFERLKSSYTVLYRPELFGDRPELLRACKDADALVVRNRTKVTQDLLASSRNLKVVARAGVGLDNIDLSAADSSGTVVVAALGANARSVGEHSLALAFALARDVVGNDRRTRDGQWDRRIGFELYGRTWGVIGLGATGRAACELASAVGMKVVGYDPYLPAEVQIPGLSHRVSSIPDLLPISDFVSLHLPLSNDTESMVNAEFLAMMRPDAYLINAARGSLVDEDALLLALNQSTIAGAALDVRRHEPPEIHPLNQHPKVIVSPHVAGLTVESQVRVTDVLAEELDLILTGKPASRFVGSLALPRLIN